MKFNKYTVGDAVHVKNTLVRYRTLQNSPSGARSYTTQWEQEPCGRVGVVVGASRRYVGYYDPGSGYIATGYEIVEYEEIPPSFVVQKTLPVWLVRFGLSNRELPVLDEDLSKYEEEFRLPFYANAPDWTEEFRKEARDYANEMPRDKKGRWVSAARAKEITG